ncbi:MAG: hypothetical protein HY831_05340 [Candidatus Aenigmarchaeota archaeon]|nr:hypothetical protein [Candidatus Aenigmarchaeota archaeon]
MYTEYVGKLPVSDFNQITDNGRTSLSYAAHLARNRSDFREQLISFVWYLLFKDYRSYVRELKTYNDGIIVERSNPDYVYLHRKFSIY